MNKLTLLALSTLLAPGFLLAQTPAQNPASAGLGGNPGLVSERHPQAGCLGAISRERRDYAGAVDQGLKSGLIDPNSRAALEKILSEITALEAGARADKNLSADACKGIYKRIVAENSGIQMTMRASPYKGAPGSK